MSRSARYRSDRLKELIQALQRIQRSDEMTEADADMILIAAVAMNIRFYRVSSSTKKTRLQLARAVLGKLEIIMDHLARARRWRW